MSMADAHLRYPCPTVPIQVRLESGNAQFVTPTITSLLTNNVNKYLSCALLGFMMRRMGAAYNVCEALTLSPLRESASNLTALNKTQTTKLPVSDAPPISSLMIISTVCSMGATARSRVILNVRCAQKGITKREYIVTSSQQTAQLHRTKGWPVSSAKKASDLTLDWDVRRYL